MCVWGGGGGGGGGGGFYFMPGCAAPSNLEVVRRVHVCNQGFTRWGLKYSDLRIRVCSFGECCQGFGGGFNRDLWVPRRSRQGPVIAFAFKVAASMYFPLCCCNCLTNFINATLLQHDHHLLSRSMHYSFLCIFSKYC